MIRLRSGLIGSMSAWLPSREIDRRTSGGARIDALGRPGAVGKIDRELLVERLIAVDRHGRRSLRVLHFPAPRLGWSADERAPRRVRPRVRTRRGD